MTAPPSPESPVAVLVPIKRFEEAKLRLAPALDGPARAALARDMAEQVLRAARPLPVTVVCDDRGVADWATDAGVEVLWTAGLGLNRAVMEGVGHLREKGFTRVVVSHADLPLAALGSLAALPRHGVVFVPDRHDDGTNVASVPADAGFQWSYGPGSFRRHCEVAHALGLAVTVIRDAGLGWDVDTPDDMVATPT